MIVREPRTCSPVISVAKVAITSGAPPRWHHNAQALPTLVVGCHGNEISIRFVSFIDPSK
jgi:hypothetical protein